MPFGTLVMCLSDYFFFVEICVKSTSLQLQNENFKGKGVFGEKKVLGQILFRGVCWVMEESTVLHFCEFASSIHVQVECVHAVTGVIK